MIDKVLTYFCTGGFIVVTSALARFYKKWILLEQRLSMVEKSSDRLMNKLDELQNMLSEIKERLVRIESKNE